MIVFGQKLQVKRGCESFACSKFFAMAVSSQIIELCGYRTAANANTRTHIAYSRIDPPSFITSCIHPGHQIHANSAPSSFNGVVAGNLSAGIVKFAMLFWSNNLHRLIMELEVPSNSRFVLRRCCGILPLVFLYWLARTLKSTTHGGQSGVLFLDDSKDACLQTTQDVAVSGAQSHWTAAV